MDCSTCRSCFSQSFDERLAGDRRLEFTLHLQACQPCDGEFALYRRVFSTIRGLPDGEARPFQAPAEVPGALARLTPAAPPRFARVAAGFLILIGLVGTHVLVFNWSRDHANSRRDPEHSGATPPVLVTAASMSSVLPSALRDHVEATDLFIRTTEKLPDEPSAREVAAADWAISSLPRLTAELRSRSFEMAPEVRPLIDCYLRDAEEDFVPRMRVAVETGTRSIREIRNAVASSRIRLSLDRMKLVVASLPRGTSFATQDATAPFVKLLPDGRCLIESKQARLAGHMSRAIEGFGRFDAQFSKSRLMPAAAYLQFEALNAAGNPAAALNRLMSSRCVHLPGPAAQNPMQGLILFIGPGSMNGAPTWAHELHEVPQHFISSFWINFRPQAPPLKSEASVLQSMGDYGPESRPLRK